jgi:hypothetical protein
MRAGQRVVLAIVLLSANGRADDGVDGKGPPMPEPIFTETVTDIDGYEPGEVEIEVNGTNLRATEGGAYVLAGGFEAEWLLTRHLGVRGECSLTRTVETPGARRQTLLGGGAALSWKLLHDFEHDFHLQAEAGARLPWDTEATVAPGDSAVPLAFDLRSGIRRGLLTVRGDAGIVLGGEVAHLPLRGALAVLTGFGTSESDARFGFWGFELDVDGARRTPAVAALDVVPHLGPVGLPFRFGFAVPWAIGVSGHQPSIGLFLRVFIETDREPE